MNRRELITALGATAFGARAALADRHHGPLLLERAAAELPEQPVGDVARAGDVALVPLVCLPHVEQLDRVVGEQPLELLERDRLERLVAAALLPAGDSEQADSVQGARGTSGVGSKL